MLRLPAIEQPLNPFPQYETMRRSQPVFHDQQTGVWHVFLYNDVQRVLSEHSTFSSRMAGDNPSETGQLFAASLINTDPPRHRQLRSLVTQAFTPRAVEALAPRISEITDALLAPALSAGTMDLIEGLAYPLPVIVIAELVGIPAADRDRFKQWSDVIVSQTRPPAEESGPSAPQDHSATHREMVEYFMGMIEERRRRPGNDLISKLLAIEEVLRYRSSPCTASRPPTRRWVNARSPPVRLSSPGSDRRMAMRISSRVRMRSTSSDPRTATSPSAKASTSAGGAACPA